jgi:serine phosphatase RsbU (regulator of sigma subunit)
MVEAGNNAVEHASEPGKNLPIVFEFSLSDNTIEARIADHTPGFELPEHIDLPDFESEGGRGLFLIKSLTDRCFYLRGVGQNQLVLHKRRSVAIQPTTPDVLQLQRRLAESEIAINEMSEELASSYESLVAMFRYSAELGSTADLNEFASRLLEDLLQLTESDAAVLRVLRDGELEMFMALPADLKARLPVNVSLAQAGSAEAETLKTREDVWFSNSQPIATADPLNAIPGARFGIVHAIGSGEQMLGTLTIVRSHSDIPLRSAQINLLHTLADFLAIQIVNVRRLDERTQSRVTRRELEIAANIQRSLLPLTLPDVKPFELAASCTNAREVGGDFYDVLRVGDTGLLLVIADVMGKGVPAALFAAVLRSAVHSMPNLFPEPAALLTAINRTLHDDLARVDMFVTAKVVFLDLRAQKIISASAGHCPLLFWPPGCLAAEVADEASFPLGIESEVAYTQTNRPFPPGAIAMLYTDGITESANAAGEMFNPEQLGNILPDVPSSKFTAEAISRALRLKLEAHRAGAPLTDDQTFIILRHSL